MEFIKVEEFLKQDNKVHTILLQWISENIEDYDLVQNGDEIMLYKDYLTRSSDKIDFDSYPLFSETQLRRFIEDKTGLLLEVHNFGDGEYSIHLNNSEWVEKQYNKLGKGLLKAYWEVALQIAKEEV